ncbi:hypothetical protein [Streptomyces sp. NBC_00019]|uniref:hypothetical protein n=1 Tax=Streptomyces sp. NBC_00019 TaxID=2975623 RepID=UPI00324E09FE
MWFFLLFKLVTNLCRDHSLNGWAKALWLIGVIVLPHMGVFIYLVARARTMGERDVEQAQHREAERATADGRRPIPRGAPSPVPALPFSLLLVSSGAWGCAEEDVGLQTMAGQGW